MTKAWARPRSQNLQALALLILSGGLGFGGGLQAQSLQPAPSSPSSPPSATSSLTTGPAWLLDYKVTPTTSPRPPITLYGQMPDVEKVAISPNGTRLALLKHTKDERFAVVLNLPSEILLTTQVGKTKVRKIEFLTDDYLGVRKSETSLLHAFDSNRNEIDQYFWIDLNSKKSIMAFDKALNLYNMVIGPVRPVHTKDGLRFYAANQNIRENRLSLYSLKPTINRIDVIDMSGEGWIYDNAGTLIAKSYHDSISKRFQIQLRNGMGWKPLHSGKFEVLSPRLLGLDETGQGLVIADLPSNKESDYSKLDFTGAITPLDLKDTLLFNTYNHRLMGSVSNHDRLYYHFKDESLKKSWDAITNALKGSQITLISYSSDLKTLVVMAEGDTQTGTYYLYKKGTPILDIIGESYPDVPDDWIAKVRWMTYRAADGLEIPAYVTLPPGRELKNLPLIVMPHGGPFSRDDYGFDAWAQALASRGYLVLQPQFRGSTGFGADFVKAGHQQMGRKMQTDLSDGVRYLAKLGVIDEKRVCIFGWSYGGYAALAGAAFDPGVYRCAASGAGVSDLTRKMRHLAEQDGNNSESLAYWNVFLGPKQTWNEWSPLRNADKITIPILLLHGTDDTRVPLEQSRIMANALKKAGKTVTLVELKNEDHFLSREATRIQMLETLIPFLETHNPPN